MHWDNIGVVICGNVDVVYRSTVDVVVVVVCGGTIDVAIVD